MRYEPIEPKERSLDYFVKPHDPSQVWHDPSQVCHDPCLVWHDPSQVWHDPSQVWYGEKHEPRLKCSEHPELHAEMVPCTDPSGVKETGVEPGSKHRWLSIMMEVMLVASSSNTGPGSSSSSMIGPRFSSKEFLVSRRGP
ncbi:hypothetical protein IGI04_036107 [Brassica rapa subsp. trilocularis]|uniref:Uncharacterized protein n=1 Tax=Brassica rapa subsp. trilocularis TaxID=1813537 RepID=A0ABQ7LDI7_BRACM|nr:hypothetical protein IGI04_036107 [Brassica rapa subsp. trilocularis]